MLFYKAIFTVKASNGGKLKVKKSFSASFGGHCRLQGRPVALEGSARSYVREGRIERSKACPKSRRLYVQNQLSHLPLSKEV